MMTVLWNLALLCTPSLIVMFVFRILEIILYFSVNFNAWFNCVRSKVPTYIINLDQPATERWNQLGKDKGKEVGAVLSAVEY